MTLPEPKAIDTIPTEQLPALLAQTAALQSAIAARLLQSTGHRPPAADTPEPDRLLTPAEAAAALGVTIQWLHRHSKQLPFARKLGHKTLRFSEAGLRRWQAARRP